MSWTTSSASTRTWTNTSWRWWSRPQGRCWRGGRYGQTRGATRRRCASPARQPTLLAVEGTGSYGAGLARYLAGRGETVLEVNRTPRTERRLRGKDDALDAAGTARAALASEALALPRHGERREALRLLLIARRSAVDVRREALGQLRGVIVTAPDQLREQLRGLPTGRLLERCSGLRRSSSAGADELATRLVLRLARRIDAATREAGELEREILAHVRARLSCRSPPRLSRCRVVWPLEAGTGATPARRAKAASERSRLRCATSPATSTDYCNNRSR